MRKLLIAAAILLAVSGSASAKLQVAVHVDVSNEKVKQELQEAMEARINSTDRYTIASKAVDADLLLTVQCLVPDGGPVVCASDVSYYPYKNLPLSRTLDDAESMAMSGLGHTSYIADTLMNRFINGSTPAILAESKSFVRESIQMFCALNPTECKMPPK